MAEFCLKHFNEMNETNYQARQVWLEEDFCESCGDWHPCVFGLRPKPLLWRLFGRAVNLSKKKPERPPQAPQEPPLSKDKSD